MRRLNFSSAILAGALLAGAGPVAGRPFRFEDLSKTDRLTAFSLSSDGKWIAYAVTTPDADENVTRSAIWIRPTGEGEARRLTSGKFKDTAPAFSPDGRTIAFLSDREGSQRIWAIDLAGGDPRVAAGYVNDIGAFHWSPDGAWFAFTSDVFPDCADAACNRQKLAERKANKIKARIAERLLYRHWDSWKDGMRTHVFRIPSSGGDALDLTPGNRDAPGFGQDTAFEVSPDGKELLFTSNPDQIEAIS